MTVRRPWQQSPHVPTVRSLLILILILFSAVACGITTAPRAVAPAAELGSTTVVLDIRDGASPVLADHQGLTLYYFAGDEADRSALRCEGECAVNWTPLTVGSIAVTKPQALPELLDTVKRPDGTLQVRYGGRPLYRFAGDHAPGDRRGQDVESWMVAHVELACGCSGH